MATAIFSSAGYWLACAVYLALAVLLAAGRVKTHAGRCVALAAAVTAVWAGVLAGGVTGVTVPGWLVGVLEALRYAVWFRAVRAIANVPLASWLTRVSNAIWLTLLVLMLALPVAAELGYGMYNVPVGVSTLVALMLALVGLVLIEQLLRNAPPAAWPAMKLASIGIGGQFAYDLFLYSQAQLLGGIDPVAWMVRGAAVAPLMPLVLLAMRRLGDGGANVFVSRHVVFYTGTLLAVGGYLCVMALGGYYVRVHGGSWGEPLQLLFLCGAAVVLASILFSESLWRRFRVFIATHFYRNKYDYRIEWLRFIKTLSATGEADARRTAIKAVAQIFRSTRGVLYMRAGAGSRFAPVAFWSESGQDADQGQGFTASSELTRLLEERQWVVDLEEYQGTPDRYQTLSLPESLSAAAGWRVILPLLDVDRLVGVMVLSEPPPPFQMTFEDRDLLKTVGRHVAVQISQQEADQKLAESRQFDAYNRFAAFVMHDLKNSVAQLQLLISNASRHRQNPQFIDDAISTISNTVGRMTRLIEQLQSRNVHGRLREVALQPLALAAVARSQSGRPAAALEGAVGDAAVQADPEKLGSVLDHVIRNAQEATDEQGVVTVRLRADTDCAVLEVEDNGTGMDAEFVRERLFRPFDSSKGARGMGVGAYQVRDYVRQLGGEVEVQSSPGRGTIFCITLPLCQTKNPAS